MQVVMKIARLSPCSCGAHTLVHLAGSESDRRARLRVSVDAGRQLLVEGAELPSAAGTMMRALVDCFHQLDISPEALLLERSSAGLACRLRSSTPRGSEHLEIEPDAGVLLAARERLPIILIEDPSQRGDEVMDSESTSAMPAVFRDFLSTLPLEGDA